MTHPLDGSRAKIARAGDHLLTLDRESRRFVDDHTYRMEIESDPETGEQIVYLRANRIPDTDPPLRLGVIAGDVLHNLRSALDHLVWQLATIGTGPKAPLNQFPIFSDPTKFSEKRDRYLHGVLEEHRIAIERYQPYRDTKEGQALAILASLNDIDKHRVVHPGMRFGRTGPSSITMTNVRRAEITGRDVTYLRDGAELYRIGKTDLIDPKQKMQVRTDVRYSIAFGEGPVAASRLDLVRVREVVGDIVEAFEPAFR